MTMKIKSFIIALLLLPVVLSANVVMANNTKQKSLISKLPKKGKIVKENNMFIARIDSDYGGAREYKSGNIEDVIEQFVMDIQDEFDTL